MMAANDTLRSETLGGTRCSSCGAGVPFEDWSRGKRRCDSCTNEPQFREPAATFVRGPSAQTAANGAYAARTARGDMAASYATNERILDDLPDSLLDEILAALEQEVPASEAPRTGVLDIISEIGIGTSAREWQYALWGFAAGFTGNVALAKYAQMSSGAAMADFVGPIVFGGVVAGGAGALIGWAISKLRER